MRWLDMLTSMDMGVEQALEIVRDREARRATFHGHKEWDRN